ncbi:MAG: hypothetical protein KF753_17750 [Caldilineaceae bacterium]|nr:hypothetical protein [Caldilineaceae bacterium]
MLYYNARYYDPALGTFLSPDTLVPDAGAVVRPLTTPYPSTGRPAVDGTPPPLPASAVVLWVALSALGEAGDRRRWFVRYRRCTADRSRQRHGRLPSPGPTNSIRPPNVPAGRGAGVRADSTGLFYPPWAHSSRRTRWCCPSSPRADNTADGTNAAIERGGQDVERKHRMQPIASLWHLTHHHFCAIVSLQYL